MQEIEMTESYGFKDSFYSCRLSQNSNTSPNNRNNQNKNSDSTSNQNQNSNNTPQKNKKIRYKCYQCGGDAYKSSKCGTCRGLKSVNSQDVMVGLLYQVMMAKLGNNSGYTVKNPPKFELKDQNKGIGIRNRNNSQIVEKGKYKQNFTKSEIDSKIGNYISIEQNSSLSSRINTNSQRIPNQIKNKNANRQYYSEGNSMKDSNSLDSSLDSLDTNPKNGRESIKSKQKQKSKNYYLNNKINNNYNYNPHFKQQISEIKEESCAAEEHTVICNICGAQGELGADYLQCKICKNFYICIKCYEEGVKNDKYDKKINKNNSDREKQQSSPKIKMKRQTSVKLTNTILIPSVQNQTKKQKSEHTITFNKERETLFDSIYQIHEHPLTRCCSNNEDFVNEGEFEYENFIDQYQPNASTNIKHRKIDRDDDYIQNTYGKIDYSEQQADLNINVNKQPYTSIMTPATFKNLFKSYDNINTKNHSQQCPASPKSQKPIEKSTGIAKLQISTIKQERESPSPSQNSLQQDNSPQNKNNTVGEIKQFIKYQSQKESEKEQSDFDKNISMTISNNYESPQSQKRIQKQKEESSNHNSSNCVSVNVSSSNPSPNSDLLNSNKVENNWNSMEITIFPILNEQVIKPTIIPEEQKDIKIDNNMLIAHRVINRDFSQWSQYSKVQTQKQKSPDVNSVDTQQKPAFNLVNSCEAQSVIINSHDVSDTKSNKQVSLEDKQIQKQKNKSYTQKKVNKFFSIRHNNNSNDKQIQQPSPQNNFFNDSQKIQQKIQENSISEPVPINLFQLSNKNVQKQESLQQKINKNQQEDSDPLAQRQCYEYRYESSGEEQQQQQQNQQLSLQKQMLQQKGEAISAQALKKQSNLQQLSNLENDLALHRLFHRTKSYVESKQCSYCGLQIRDTSIYMTCTTCAKNNESYQLCDGCSGSNKILNQHGANGEKHIFKPNLYKKPGISNLEMEQQKYEEYKEDQNLYNQKRIEGHSEQYDESDWRKSISLQPQQIKQTQKQIPKPQQIQKIQIKQTKKQETHKMDHKITEPNIRASSNIMQDLYSSIYRQKKRLQCLKNQKYKQLISNILGTHIQNAKATQSINKQDNNLDESARWLSIEYSGYSNSNKNSINNNYNNNNDSLDSPALKASNPGIWISQPNSLIHNSSSVIPTSLMYSFSNNNSNTIRKSLIDDLNNFQSNKCTENNKPSIDIGGKQEQLKKQKNTSLLLADSNFAFKLEHNQIYNQSNINIITTTKTINSEQAPSSVIEQDIAVSYQIQSSSQISLLSKLKSKSHNQIDRYLNSSNRQAQINKSNQYLEVRHQSPKKSIGCQTGGSPERSEMSSRIKVDCGQTDSQHEYDKNILVEEESLNQSKKTTSHWVNVETEEKQLQKDKEDDNRFQIKGIKGKLMRLSSKGNIIGKQQVESEQLSQNQEESLKASMKTQQHHYRQLMKGKIQKLKRNKKEITDRILNKIGHKGKNYQEQFQGQFQYHNPQQIAKQFHLQSNKQQQKRQVKSRSRSQEHTSRSSVMSSMKDKKQKLISSNSSHEEDINSRLKMDFLGNIQKSEKLERSEGSIDHYDQQKSLRIHFNYEDYSKEQDKKKYQAEENNSIVKQKRQQKIIDRQNSFVFEQYRCDKCSEPPIGCRYHCKICEDYDLCRQCYASCNKFHEHDRNSFEQITREMQIKRDLQEQKKKQQAKNIKDQIIMGLNPRNRPSYVSRGSLQNVNRLSLPGSNLGVSTKMTQSTIGRNTPAIYVPKFQSSVYNMGRSSNI